MLKEARFFISWLVLFFSQKFIVLSPLIFLKNVRLSRKSLLTLLLLSGYFISMGFLGVYQNNSFGPLVNSFEYLLFIVLYFLLKEQDLTESELKFFINGSIVFLLVSILFYPLLTWSKTGDIRFQGFFEHPNQLAYFSILVLVISFLYLKELLPRVSVVCFLVLVLTQSLGATLTLIGCTFFLYFDQKKVSFKQLFYFFFIFLFIVSLLSFLFWNRIENTIFSLSTLEGSSFKTGFGGGGSGSWRLAYWFALLQFFFSQSTSDIVLGFGPGTISADNYLFSFIKHDPHNELVRILYEYGVLGISLFVLILRRVFRIHGAFFVVIMLGCMLDNYLEMNVIILPLIYALAYSSSYNRRVI